jgi:hypothetical protein
MRPDGRWGPARIPARDRLSAVGDGWPTGARGREDPRFGVRVKAVTEFLRRAGLNIDEVEVEATGLVEWRGGGPDMWA